MNHPDAYLIHLRARHLRARLMGLLLARGSRMLKRFFIRLPVALRRAFPATVRRTAQRSLGFNLQGSFK